MTLEEAFYKMAEREGISVFKMEMEEGIPTHHCIRLMGERGMYEGHAIFLEDEKLFVFYIIWGVIVPEKDCEAAAWELMKINYGLKMGQWLIDPDSLVLTLRTSQYLLDGGDVDRMRTIVENCGKLADEGFPVFSALFSSAVDD